MRFGHQGRPQDVGKRLASFNIARLPREWRLPLAKICRRAGLLPLGLKLLAQIILVERIGKEAEATPEELAEYAVLLQRSGALREALDKLNLVDTSRVPEALLYRAFIHFARWEFHQAIPHLEKYLQADLSPHAKAVGQVNLAFALVESQRNDDAVKILEEISTLESPQMLSNRHALLGQVRLQEGDYPRARMEFARARNLVPATQTNDQFFALKGSLISDGLENKDLSAFNSLRELAIKNRAWEALREADLYSLKVNFEHERFMHLYCGSPYQGFRERVSAELKVIPNEAVFILGPRSAPCMDLSNGRIDDKAALNPGRKCHQLIDLLLHDFYRPLRVGGIFSGLFADEPFNATTSSHRVHQLISRTRLWLKSEKIPVAIIQDGSFYSLNIEGLFSFAVPLQRNSVDLPQLQFEKLKSVFGQAQFSVKDATEKLRLSPATVHRLIRRGIQERTIELAGAINRASLFKISSLSQKRTA